MRQVPIPHRRRLTDILHGDQHDRLAQAWDMTEPAKGFPPLPAGVYECHVVEGNLDRAGTGTPGFKLVFRVIDGDFAGRLVWHDIWLTAAAMPMAKSELAKLGITAKSGAEALKQLERPLPPGKRCRVHVALRTGDDGTQRNRVRSFDVIGIDPPEVDPFAPVDSGPISPKPTSGFTVPL
jgi:hypothetical protein